MKRIKAFIRMMLGFSQTETNAFLVLLPLMLVVIISEPVYQTYFMSRKPDNPHDQRMIDSVVAAWQFQKENQTIKKNKWNDSLRKPYKNYTSDQRKSGRYNSVDSSRRFKNNTTFKPQLQKEKFDLNLADTTQLKSIYGIGPTLARRIVTYRTNLGGFIAPEQLYEIWGLDSLVISRLSERTVIAPGFTPNKLAINHCSEQDLARHPYIRTKLARAIVNYRFQHGNYTSSDDLKKIGIMEEKTFLRIKAYITLD